MENYDKIKAVIQEANPEIMELKFGCEVKVLCDDSDFYGKEKPYWQTVSIYKVSEKKAVIYVLWHYPNDAIAVHEMTEKGRLRILGRPIRLSDVVKALSRAKLLSTEKDGMVNLIPTAQIARELRNSFAEVCCLWKCEDDNLDNQSDSCKQFLINLLVGLPTAV